MKERLAYAKSELPQVLTKLYNLHLVNNMCMDCVIKGVTVESLHLVLECAAKLIDQHELTEYTFGTERAIAFIALLSVLKKYYPHIYRNAAAGLAGYTSLPMETRKKGPQKMYIAIMKKYGYIHKDTLSTTNAMHFMRQMNAKVSQKGFCRKQKRKIEQLGLMDMDVETYNRQVKQRK